MELLAPAGNIENYHAAIDSGADAVYMGAPGINARNLSRDLKLEEIAAMIEHAHSLAKKVYLAANSLILERDLANLIESLAVFERLNPDGLIVQDLAVIQIIKQYFPELPIHASTLMGAHNSATINLLADMGCSRVVAARELTLKELADLQKKARVELEVFVHGAMCYSFSGLCLFSSFLGGKSGLRGRCVQPCRRGYTWSAKQKHSKSRRSGGGGNYLFSMNDLEGFEAIPYLQEAGIASLKIEGRLRSATYVSKIVSAYRLVMDAEESTFRQAVGRAEMLAEQAMSRKTSPGYFFSPQPRDAIVPYHSGNMGLHMGSLRSVVKRHNTLLGKILLKKPVRVGDRLRIHVENTGERKGFTLNKLFLAGQPVDAAEGGDSVQIELPDGQEQVQNSRVEVYKVDTGNRSQKSLLFDVVHAKKTTIGQIKKSQIRKVNRVKDELIFTPSSLTQQEGLLESGQRKTPKGRKKMELWLKIDSPQLVFGRLPFVPDILLLSMEKNILSQSAQIKKHFGRNSRNIIWALPSVLFERDFGRMKKQISLLIRSGFRNFQIGHIGQRWLFGRERVRLYGDYTLNIANSQAAKTFAAEQFEGVQAAIELDRDGMRSLVAGFNGNTATEPGMKKMKIGVTVYGAPPLFTSRLDADHFQYKKNMVSPKGEEFTLLKQEGVVLTLPVRPFSLLPYLEDINAMGYDYAVVDICRMKTGEKEMRELGDRLQGNTKLRKLPTFNYLGRLE